MRYIRLFCFIKEQKKVIILFLAILIKSSTLYSQMRIDGRIMEENDMPVPYASIKIMNKQKGCASDMSGNFSLPIESLQINDTLVITSIGYELLKIPASAAIKEKQYRLRLASKKMETVEVHSFNKESMAGAQTDNISYFRAWNINNKGGEIGRSFVVPYKKYQVNRVRFKIFSTCDTAIIRIHIREIFSKTPGEELLKDSVADIFIKPSVGDKTYDFDLTKYNLILSRENIFVSFELLKGSNSGNCSLAFAGHEQGNYIYKKSLFNEWDESNEYSIYMKLFYGHD